MKVHGYEIEPDQEVAVLAAMQKGFFTAADLAKAAAAAGVPSPTTGQLAFTAARFAARIIQRERKAGRIVLRRGYWRRVGEDGQKGLPTPI